VAVNARFLGGFGVVRFAVGSRRGKQKAGGQNKGGDDDFQVSHEDSTSDLAIAAPRTEIPQFQ
jgi:hypothetical protein